MKKKQKEKVNPKINSKKGGRESERKSGTSMHETDQNTREKEANERQGKQR